MRTATPQDSYDFFTLFMGPAGVVAAVVCGIAVISNYAFPAQRKFPNIVLVWTCVVDLVAGIYIAMRWIKGPLKLVLTDRILPGSMTCLISTYFDLAIEIGSGIVCIIVAYTLHATIVRNVDIEEFSQKYYKRFVITLWAASILFPLLTFIDLHAPTQGVGFCTLSTNLGTGLIVVPYVVMLLIELWYIIPVFIYTAKVKRRVSVHTIRGSISLSRAQVWLYLRFLGILQNQVILWGSVIIWDIKSIYGKPVPLEHIYIIGVSPILLVLNGLIVLIGNRSLKEFLLRLKDKIVIKWRTKRLVPKMGGQLEVLEEQPT